MNPLLQKALQKLGLKSFNELNELERETFKTWENILQGKKITQEDVITEIANFQEKILVQLEDANLTEKVRSYLLAQLSVVRLVLRTVESPKQDVRRVEQEIEALAGR